ncbi:hypothetical protein BDP27DRAFT_618246 [Rhodocollybia butyracea]|uniref:Uncharacterized protein n=1 Tax=Rhodocollybia butyracea TaxID=206335 RepID=A0A9P5P4R9_9AGAR|nr:hypothetical protein BDP27DRAFT_618246 [Rhodocollybia butyracea]
MNEKTGPAATSSMLGGQAAPPANGLQQREHNEYHAPHHYDISVLEEAIERINHAKERVRAADDHLCHLLRMKDEGEFVSKHRLRKAKHRLEKAKHRLHVAEEHLQHVEHAFNKGEFDHEVGFNIQWFFVLELIDISYLSTTTTLFSRTLSSTRKSVSRSSSPPC